MTAVTYDIKIEQGATFRLSLIYEDSNGDPIDLTGYTARMQVRRKHSDPVALLDFTTENGAIVLGGVTGTITVTGLASITEDIPAKPCVYDLELVNGTEVDRIIEGCAEVTPEVTR